MTKRNPLSAAAASVVCDVRAPYSGN